MKPYTTDDMQYSAELINKYIKNGKDLFLIVTSVINSYDKELIFYVGSNSLPAGWAKAMRQALYLLLQRYGYLMRYKNNQLLVFNRELASYQEVSYNNYTKQSFKIKVMSSDDNEIDLTSLGLTVSDITSHLIAASDIYINTYKERSI